VAIEFSAFDERIDHKTHLVAVRGEIDIFTAPEFKERVAAAIDAGAGAVVVDLSGTTFLDSSSLGVLISAHRRLESRGGRLLIACDVQPVLNTFRITGLDTMMHLHRTREDALAAAASPPADD
jgi:anti-sigma B factor antagonist